MVAAPRDPVDAAGAHGAAAPEARCPLVRDQGSQVACNEALAHRVSQCLQPLHCRRLHTAPEVTALQLDSLVRAESMRIPHEHPMTIINRPNDRTSLSTISFFKINSIEPEVSNVSFP